VGSPARLDHFHLPRAGKECVTVSDLNLRFALAGGGIAVFIFRGLIPGFGVADFPLQLFGGEMRLLKGFSSGVGQVGAGRLRCFLISQTVPPQSGLMVSVAAVTAGGDTGRHMKLLNFLVESFIGAFGITRPKAEQQRTVAWALGGFLLVFFTSLISLILWMLFGQHR
jgi:hypothetical protein